jgi:hypothetical protein
MAPNPTREHFVFSFVLRHSKRRRKKTLIDFVEKYMQNQFVTFAVKKKTAAVARKTTENERLDSGLSAPLEQFAQRTLFVDTSAEKLKGNMDDRDLSALDRVSVLGGTEQSQPRHPLLPDLSLSIQLPEYQGFTPTIPVINFDNVDYQIWLNPERHDGLGGSTPRVVHKIFMSLDLILTHFNYGIRKFFNTLQQKSSSHF